MIEFDPCMDQRYKGIYHQCEGECSVCLYKALKDKAKRIEAVEDFEVIGNIHGNFELLEKAV